MLKGIDHIVILVQTLAAGSADYEKLGFTVTPGGEHVGLGTHNSLVPFADGAYFELIAFKEPEKPVAQRWYPRLAKGEGLMDYCLYGDHLGAEIAAIGSRGFAMRGPIEMGRARPDGIRIDWKLIVNPANVGETVGPFVIEDTTPRELRVPGGAAARHPLNVDGIRGIVIGSRDLHVSATTLRQVFGSPGESVTPSVAGAAAAIRFQVGPNFIEVAQPTADGELAQHVARFGDCPYEVWLRSPAGAPVGGTLLNVGLAHGARLRIVG